MTAAEHQNYAKDLLSSLSDDHPDIESFDFSPERAQSRNAARAITAILCHRLFKKTRHQATRITNTTYEWKEGIFNNRNITDRDSLWTNIRHSVADVTHQYAVNKPVAYLLAFSHPSDITLNVWVIPEPLLHDSLSSLPIKKGGQEHTLQIFTNKQRIEHYPASPDLASYFREFSLSRQELLVLKKARKVDAMVKRERAIARGEEEPYLDDGEDDSDAESETNTFLGIVTQQLVEAGVFDPSGISDARERVLSSIVRRRGQPAFRQQLLAAYNCRCAISECEVEPVLEAAHIVPYMGPETNHLGNGLLLRADLHTLFDLKLIAIDVASMTLVVSPSLAGTCYEALHGTPIKVPESPHSRPDRQALDNHRKESGL